MRTQRIQEQSPSEGEAKSARSWIIKIGCAGQPMSDPELIYLDERKQLILGRRNDEPSANTEPNALTDRLEQADPWMSSDHAELRRSTQGWLLSDLGSSNGTLVWGKRKSTALLHDGDIFETGSTFWLFRARALSDNELPKQLSADQSQHVLSSFHPGFIAVCERLRRVARTRVPIMLLGGTGTGKEVLAKAVHRYSSRPGPFVAINTAAVQPNLVASELFGVEKGAHSTADRARRGQIRSADGGTLLLDEIGDMPLEVQVSLLRVLQESEVVPVGGDTPVSVDARFVCATHQDLGEMVESGRFRSDLFARLKGCMLRIPALSERPEDIGLLVQRFLQRFGAEDLSFSPAAYRALLVYPWPLNIRELEKNIETAIALSEKGRIDFEDLSEEIREFRVERSEPSSTDESSRERELLRLLAAHRGNVSAVARSMGYSRMQVHRWLKQLNVDPGDFRG